MNESWPEPMVAAIGAPLNSSDGGSDRRLVERTTWVPPSVVPLLGVIELIRRSGGLGDWDGELGQPCPGGNWRD